MAITIRRAEPRDGDAIHAMFVAIAREGLAFMYTEADVDKDRLLEKWLHPAHHTYVAEMDGSVAGAYIVLPNQPGRGAHIANATYMVHESARGHGLGRMLGEHSLEIARAAGFRGMQYNAVISTNTAAVRLWESLGFRVIGTVPGGFHHPDGRYVDHLIMFRTL